MPGPRHVGVLGAGMDDSGCLTMSAKELKFLSVRLLTRGDVSFGDSEGTWLVQGLFAYTVGRPP